MSKSFADARKLRRRIISELAQQQKADAEASKQLRETILTNTREILENLSTLLEQIDLSQEKLCSAIAPSFSLHEWLANREQHSASINKVQMLQAELAEAEKAYRDVSPFGVVSKLFKSEHDKSISDDYKRKRDRASFAVLAELREQARLEQVLQSNAKVFFVQSMQTHSLEYLRGNPSPVSAQINAILQNMASRVQTITEAHSSSQTMSLKIVQANVTDLKAAYSDGATLEHHDS